MPTKVTELAKKKKCKKNKQKTNILITHQLYLPCFSFSTVKGQLRIFLVDKSYTFCTFVVKTEFRDAILEICQHLSFVRTHVWSLLRHVARTLRLVIGRKGYGYENGVSFFENDYFLLMLCMFEYARVWCGCQYQVTPFPQVYNSQILQSTCCNCYRAKRWQRV